MGDDFKIGDWVIYTGHSTEIINNGRRCKIEGDKNKPVILLNGLRVYPNVGHDFLLSQEWTDEDRAKNITQLPYAHASKGELRKEGNRLP
jgi:hypothetical protein